MKILKKIFAAEDSHKDVNAILARGKSLLEKNFYEWATVEFNKALTLNPKLDCRNCNQTISGNAR